MPFLHNSSTLPNPHSPPFLSLACSNVTITINTSATVNHQGGEAREPCSGHYILVGSLPWQSPTGAGDDSDGIATGGGRKGRVEEAGHDTLANRDG